MLVNTGLCPRSSPPSPRSNGSGSSCTTPSSPSEALGLPADLHRVDEAGLAELIAAALPGDLQPPPREGRTIVLTSGTTGAQGGRPTPHGFGPLVSIIDRIPLRVRDTVLIAAPLFHTWGYAALQVCFALRATIVLHRRFDPAATLGALVARRRRHVRRAGDGAAPDGGASLTRGRP